MGRTRRRQAVVWAAVPVLALGLLAGCSSDDDDDGGDDTTTTTAASGGESAETVAFDRTVQQELKDVGCYAGEVDGIIGPETDAAIVAFQTAKGLTVDGELGPETDTALEEAAANGETVCSSSPDTTTTTTTGGGGSAPCTASAITAALPSGAELQSYVCSEGWAAGTATESGNDTKFTLEDEGGAWAAPGQDPCGSASAGLPPVILEEGCPS